MEYRLLGPVEARRNGEVIGLGQKPRALLALLLINANQVLSSDRIIDELWGDDPGKNPQNTLWVAISRLRSTLEPDREKRSDGSILLTQMPGYRLVTDTDSIDSVRFKQLVGDGQDMLYSEPEQAAELLRSALGLWHGHALEEFTYEPFASAEIARLEDLRLTTVEDLVDAELRLGRWRDLVGELEGRVHENPLRQRMVGQLMLALHLSGRQSEALRTYEQHKRLLVEEQGLDPSADLMKLEEQILLDDPGLRPVTTEVVGSIGLSVRGYEIRDQIGADSMGNIYRAFQPAVGRQVAIKVIRPDLANTPEFIRRFEVEAKASAQLEHPQIVPVFDYWREPDSAYLVMRYFEHGSLMTAVEDEALSIDHALLILGQIGGALNIARSLSSTHRSLKPENIFLDGEGNAYLSAFDLSASRTEGETISIDPAIELSDTKRFAALSEFVLRNTVQDEQRSHSALDELVIDIIDRARNSAEFSDVGAFLRALTKTLGNSAVRALPSTASNPYQGLRAFDADDASHFYGRERLIDRLVVRLGHPGPQGRFLALVGPSGSGKSSVVRAGVVPALRQGAVLGSEDWFVVTMTPGSRPFDSLADALRSIAVDPPVDLAVHLETDGIALTIERISADPSSQVVIVVDQFEELFTQTAEPEGFINALVKMANDRHSGVKLIVTMRADFYDRPLQHNGLGELLRLGTEVITPMAPEELQRAITQPANDVDVSFEPGAVARITADMADQSSALPLMQHVLTELFDQRKSSVLSLDSYLELGGVSGALAHRADMLIDNLDSRSERSARDLFLRLVTVQADSADTRRRARVAEIHDVVGPHADALLDAFGKHRLLSFDQDPITRAPTVQIAHEALLTSWGRLRHWIEEARLAVSTQHRLAASVQEWDEHGQNPGLLLSESRLLPYDGWLEQPPIRLSEREIVFLTKSSDARALELVAEQDRLRRLRRLVGVAGGGFLVAAMAAGAALWQQSEASNAADRAEAQTVVAEQSAENADLERLRAQAVAEVVGNPPLAALLAVEAYNIDESLESAGSIHRVLTGVEGRVTTMFDTTADYGGRSVLSSNRAILATSGSAAVDVWDIDDRSLLLRLDVPYATYDMSADASLIAITSDNSTKIDLVAVPSGATLATLSVPHCRVLNLSPDGERLAILSSNQGCDVTTPLTLQIWDISNPVDPVLEHRNEASSPRGAWWSPDGDFYVTVNLTGAVEYWDAASHERLWLHQLELGEGEFSEPAVALYRSNSSAVVIGVQTSRNSGISLLTFDTTTGDQVYSPTPSAGLGSMTWWDAEETEVAGTFWPSGVAVYDLAEGEEVLPPPLVDRNAATLHIDHDGQRIITAGFIGVSVRSLDGRSVLETRVSLTPAQLAIKAESDGQLMASLSSDGSKLLMSIVDFSLRSPVVEWDMTTDPPTVVAETPTAITASIGDATLHINQVVQVLDGKHEPLGPPIDMERDRGTVILWRASGDGSRTAGSRLDIPIIELYDTMTGKRTAELSVPGAVFLNDYSFNYDGTRIVGQFFNEQGPVWAIFDGATGELLNTGTNDELLRPWLSGDTLYTEGENFALERRDIDTLEEIGLPLVGHTLLLNGIDDDPDSRIIATQASNGTVRVWDRTTGDQVGREIAIGRQSSGTYVDTAKDGKIVAVVLDTEYGIWNYDIDTWPNLACDLAGRNMTQREWDDFGPKNADYRVTCPQFPANN